ncbi:SHOCT domain-containing protein [Planococcus sp. APC 3906]|uniref:SHOCT domain-containing protein n=1 Tax=Planococcus sp. APC 3906 TaxID=3035194 RepID=UPI0025B6053B|nr:SHOCT domain-containing protein [Planococcus sp. APC 3906]MDN3449439.1 SHOCT domain-containing protein [Planococcus sp. APC 3906]
MWNYGMHNGSWGNMFFWAIFLLVVVVLAVVLVVYFMRKTPPAEIGNRSSSSALDLLKERYARGEISTEEYRERLRELEGYDIKK